MSRPVDIGGALLPDDFQDTEGDAYVADSEVDGLGAEQALRGEPDPELEALLATQPPEDDLAELDALLDESMEQRAVEAEAKKARERLRRGGQSQAEREADVQRVKDWQDKYEWTPVATAGVFNRFSCTCGNVTTIFDCVMVEEKHKTDSHAKRFVNIGIERRTTPRTSEPPRVTVVRELRTECCDKCAHTRGWRLDDPTIWRG